MRIINLGLVAALIVAVNPPPASAHEPHASPHVAAGQSSNTAAYDLRFIDTMRAHHEQGIQMAQMAEQRASTAELRAMAKKMIADQRKDQAELASWRKKWYGAAAGARDMSLPGASAMNMDMSSLRKAAGHDFDHQFISMMIPHHEGAISMGREGASKAAHAELRRKAEEIADKQQREVADLKKMQAAMGAR